MNQCTLLTSHTNVQVYPHILPIELPQLAFQCQRALLLQASSRCSVPQNESSHPCRGRCLQSQLSANYFIQLLPGGHEDKYCILTDKFTKQQIFQLPSFSPNFPAESRVFQQISNMEAEPSSLPA